VSIPGWKCDKARQQGDARIELVAADLISRARAGDGEAFRELTEPYRRELQVHCYRMLGSFTDAEDALQDTLLAAWQGLGGFDGRASLRTWLYKIATNRCLNARRAARRRPASQWNIPGVEPPEPTRLGEVVWLESFPDALLDGAVGAAARPGGPLRAGRIRLAGLRDRPAGPAAPPARRAHPARRPVRADPFR
jgi:RNA polymerase sigma-70 factor (ECF subfamily)